MIPTAAFGRRLLALAVDWALGVALAALLVGDWSDPRVNSLALGCFFAVRVASGAVGLSPGQALAGIRVRRTDGTRPDLLRVALRTGLLCLVIPAIMTREGRGWHDRLADTVVSEASAA